MDTMTDYRQCSRFRRPGMAMALVTAAVAGCLAASGCGASAAGPVPAGMQAAAGQASPSVAAPHSAGAQLSTASRPKPSATARAKGTPGSAAGRAPGRCWYHRHRSGIERFEHRSVQLFRSGTAGMETG
jgi:hypothetical protein